MLVFRDSARTLKACGGQLKAGNPGCFLQKLKYIYIYIIMYILYNIVCAEMAVVCLECYEKDGPNSA